MSEKTRTIIIRTDGNEIIATGHVMRCLSVAVQLRKLGAEVVFVTADEKPSELIRRAGFEPVVLGTDWQHMEEELPGLLQVLEGKEGVLFVDSYQVTEGYFAGLPQDFPVAYLDDMYAFAYDVDLLINYGAYTDETKYRALYEAAHRTYPKTCFGISYVPLREEFAVDKRELHEKAESVLVTMGGTDRNHMILSLLEAYEALRQRGEAPEVEFHPVVGAFCEDKEKIYGFAKGRSWVHIHENVTAMAPLMLSCDMAISAAGSTIYEFCACGTPMVCVETADNQDGVSVYEKEGYLRYAGNAYKDPKGCAGRCIEIMTELAADFEARKEMSARMQSLVDGLGARRIAEALLSLA